MIYYSAFTRASGFLRILVSEDKVSANFFAHFIPVHRYSCSRIVNLQCGIAFSCSNCTGNIFKGDASRFTMDAVTSRVHMQGVQIFDENIRAGDQAIAGGAVHGEGVGLRTVCPVNTHAVVEATNDRTGGHIAFDDDGGIPQIGEHHVAGGVDIVQSDGDIAIRCIKIKDNDIFSSLGRNNDNLTLELRPGASTILRGISGGRCFFGE